jgi:transcriptional regulator with XRE-family HTH domain
MESEMRDAHREATVAYVDHLVKTTGLDLTNLARRSGVSSTTLTRFRNDPLYTNSLSARTLKKLSDATGVPLPPELGGSIAAGRSSVQTATQSEIALSIASVLQEVLHGAKVSVGAKQLKACAQTLADHLAVEFVILRRA